MAEGYVLLADLVHSRRVEDRSGLENRLRTVLDGIRDHPDIRWHAALEAVKGIDELSSVLSTPERAYDVVWMVNLAVWPERFRFAFGFGEIDIGWATRRAGSMDGSAYHRTSEALARARTEKIGFALALPGVAPDSLRVVEMLARMHEILVDGWSPREADMVRAYARLRRQADVGESLGVTKQAVSDALRRAHDRDLAVTRDAIAAWLAANTRHPESRD